MLVAIGGAASTLSQPMSDKFSIPGIESEQAQTLQQELFPQTQDAFDQATGTVVVQAPAGEKLSDPANSAAVDDLLTELRDVPQVGSADQFVNPVTAAKGSSSSCSSRPRRPASRRPSPGPMPRRSPR